MKQLHVTHRGRTLGTITVSLGVAVYPEDGASWSELANAADHALYKAKEEGRDRVVTARSGTQTDRPPIHVVRGKLAGPLPFPFAARL